VSSLFALFAQNGPFVLDWDLNVSLREYTWGQEFSLLYIDNPVGAGFSFTENDLGTITFNLISQIEILFMTQIILL
jgi:vitellogenic carboxypeptidase-like protein